MDAASVMPHEDLRSQLKASERSCYYEDEFTLAMHKNYTQVKSFHDFLTELRKA